jgi:hypothetical protein
VWTISEADQVLSNEDAARIETTFIASLQELPQLRQGVRDGLLALHEAGIIVFVITEGSRDRIIRTARAWLEGLSTALSKPGRGGAFTRVHFDSSAAR